MRSTDILTFEPFHLDLRAEQLWRGTEAVPLPPKTFAVLRYLVLHAGTLVTRDAVLEAVWGTQYVSDAALASCIRDIRQALGEQAQTPQFLETVRGRGFRFLASVGTAPARPPLPTAERRPSSVVRAPALVVGRATELAYLQRCLDSALRGDRQIVFLTGEPGIGKTTLIDAFLTLCH
jgi:DNA-binding winged helix-turn-helix (wHTH) protein